MGAHDSAFAGFGNYRHGALFLSRPVALGHAMQEQDINVVGAQPFQRGFRNRADIFRPAVDAGVKLVGIDTASIDPAAALTAAPPLIGAGLVGLQQRATRF